VSPGLVTRATENSRAASAAVAPSSRSGCWVMTASVNAETIAVWLMPAGATYRVSGEDGEWSRPSGPSARCRAVGHSARS